MNSSALAQSAYGDTSLAVRTDKSVEYQAFARATNMLTDVQSDTANSTAKLAEAIYFNRKLWSILATDVADDGNRLPDQLRAQILSLANFVWQHSSKALGGNAKVAPLIDINTSIMRGLRAETKG